MAVTQPTPSSPPTHTPSATTIRHCSHTRKVRCFITSTAQKGAVWVVIAQKGGFGYQQIRVGLVRAHIKGCGEKGHFKDRCPRARNQPNEGAHGRAYVVIKNRQQNLNVATGMFLRNDHYACILFDSSAEKSFVSSAFTPFINISPDTLNTSYEVELADKKIFRIPLPNGKILEVQCERPEKDLRSLACIKADEKKLDDIRVVRDFLEVFLDDLLGLPLVREIEFRIDLISGASLVVRSILLSPFKNVRIVKPAQRTSRVGFYRPSYSPWGATVLFVKKKDGSIRICIDYRE
ncbi:hypothetical protein Tco_0647611 [Tanacetum coccineum]